MIPIPLLIVFLSFLSLIANGAELDVTDPSYENAKMAMESQYQADKLACDALKGKQKDVCNAKADGAVRVRQHELDAMLKGDVNSHVDAAKSKASAQYELDSAQCAGLADKSQSLCLEKAKNKLELGNADAIRREKTYDATIEARKKVQDANFELAMKKCESLADQQKLDCQVSAKATYNH